MALARSGFELRRTGRRAAPVREKAPSFYQTSPTCQIPNLSWLYELFFGQRDSGLFVEVGAYDGWSFSNTSCLVSAGWSGHFVEAVPEFAALCRERYADNPRVTVHECAAGARPGEIDIAVGGALSTSDKAVLEEYKTVDWATDSFKKSRSISVKQVTLTDLLQRSGVPARFEVLVVDVEGYESEVFAGFDLRHWRPQMLIVELTDAHPDLTSSRRSHAELTKEIVGHGYCVAYKDSINTMFVTDELYATTHGLRGPEPLSPDLGQ